ncbi:MAG: FGGY family carbohydrate kinase [Balneolaceae bacterium]|nr:FGGY family carbohydrate kinase [Balneolaceae bacterium]
MYLLGYDIGSSSIKASLVEAAGGKRLASAQSPQKELPMDAPRPGWAEQHPDTWWKHLVRATHDLLSSVEVRPGEIEAIGISYQMHGLVLVDREHVPIRPSIIWCDGRAVGIGEQAFQEIGKETCLRRFLNSPGNFTASKLRWVREQEPELYSRAFKFMLPGDYIALKMTGNLQTTISGLSEAILWDYTEQKVADRILDHYEIENSLVPEAVPNFSEQGSLTAEAANELGLAVGTKVTYRAGDQPNNALSLNVLQPGEVASTAGTSGVIYGVTDRPLYDDRSRVNTFVHVNHQEDEPRFGVLLCINGTGIQYSWLKNSLFEGSSPAYPAMNEMARSISVGSDGVTVLPFGNGPERILGNRNPGARIGGIEFNRHSASHIIRAAQEGIAFALNYGLEVMKTMGMEIETIRVGHGNMFQSPVFREAFVNATGTAVELYDTDGSQGAAIGAGIGAGIYDSREEAFAGLSRVETIEPDPGLADAYREAYVRWEAFLEETVSRHSEISAANPP